MAGSTESNARMQNLVDNHGPNGCPPGYRKIASGDCVKMDIDPGFNRGPSKNKIKSLDQGLIKDQIQKLLGTWIQVFTKVNRILLNKQTTGLIILKLNYGRINRT